MKAISAIMSKGPADFGVWLESFEGIYGAGNSEGKALANLIEAMDLYVKHNSDAPKWLKSRSYTINVISVTNTV